jgi:hypothetical protein
MAAWRVADVEVLRPEFDAHGYDLVMARGPIVRHIQFKTGTSRKPVDVSVSQALAEKPSGCVIWIRVAADLDMGPFFWFGAAPGMPLPTIDGYPNPLRATHNKQGVRPLRKNHRLIPREIFRQLANLDSCWKPFSENYRRRSHRRLITAEAPRRTWPERSLPISD